MTEENDKPAKPKHLKDQTPEEIAKAFQELRESEWAEKIIKGKGSDFIIQGAKSLHSFESPEDAQTKDILAHCGKISISITDFEIHDIEGLLPLLSAQAILLDGIFNRAIQLSGLHDTDTFCPFRAKLALQAQRQCKSTLKMMHRDRERLVIEKWK